MTDKTDKDLKTLQMAVRLARIKRNRLESGVTVFGRRNKTNKITQEDKCFLCEENRQLEKAHIIPAHIFSGVEYEGSYTSQLDDVIMLCPTHHKCFDNNKLNEVELSKLRPILDEYVKVVSKILKSIELVIPKEATKEDRERLSYKIDVFIIKVWKWWRIYGNC